jgi:uncharacterized protein (DUF362 family)
MADNFGNEVSGVGRRQFLKRAAADVAMLVVGTQLASAAGNFQVGVGKSNDGYTAAQRAIAACGQWPAAALAGKTVVIKPNLVLPKLASTGVTTDPQVVRAIVDLALSAQASRVIIIEGGNGNPAPANFTACGYDFFNTYDPRVQLLDLASEPVSLTPVPNGLAYQSIYLPNVILDPNAFVISVAKLKTHVNSTVSLSLKNMFGLAPPSFYLVPKALPRYDMHLRGVDESIIDLHMSRPADFAVVDGVWGLEGNGPLNGTPVATNLVVAGLSSVAVDRVCVQIMGMPQNFVAHLVYAAMLRLGPLSPNSITFLGDAFTPTNFIRAVTAPVIIRPSALPATFSLSAGQQTSISYWIPARCDTLVEIIQDSDASPALSRVRTLRNWGARPAGAETIQWNGTTDAGAPVTPGRYQIHVLATYGAHLGINFATGFVTVNS